MKIIQLCTEDQKLCENAKNEVCEDLMKYRMETRQKNQGLKTDEDYYQGVTVVYPTNVTK